MVSLTFFLYLALLSKAALWHWHMPAHVVQESERAWLGIHKNWYNIGLLRDSEAPSWLHPLLLQAYTNEHAV
jgi:hypothetical protein